MVGLAALAMAAGLVPQASEAPDHQRRAGRYLAVHRGGDHSRRTVDWNAPTTSPNSATQSLATLRDRSRAAVRNDGYAKGAVDKLVTNVVGTGIKPLSKVADRKFRKAQQSLWTAWTDESDPEGQLDFYGQQGQATRCWFEAGECFVRLRPRFSSDGMSVPLQVQVLEPEFCPYHYSERLANGNWVLNGIEYNAIGRRVAYWFYSSRPVSAFQDFDISQRVRVPAWAVVHVYDPLRPGQRRGLPMLSPALVTLNELDKFDDATLLRQQLANMFVGFLKKPEGQGADSLDLDPITGLPQKKVAGKPMTKLQPGMFTELEPGEEIEFVDPPDSSQTYPAFMKQQLFRSCAATGVPYELFTGDMSALNDRTIRVVLHEFRRRIQAWQHQIIAFKLCRAVWREWNDQAFLAGALPYPATYAEDPTPWTAAVWTPQGWPYIHPVQDVEAKKLELRSGLTSRSRTVSDAGDDAEEIDREQQEDNKRADDLGLKYDSDGRQSASNAKVPLESPEPELQPASTRQQMGALR